MKSIFAILLTLAIGFSWASLATFDSNVVQSAVNVAPPDPYYTPTNQTVSTLLAANQVPGDPYFVIGNDKI